MVVFLRFGEFVTGGPHFPLTADALKKVFTGEASTEIFGSILHAVCSLFMFPFDLSLMRYVISPIRTFHSFKIYPFWPITQPIGPTHFIKFKHKSSS